MGVSNPGLISPDATKGDFTLYFDDGSLSEYYTSSDGRLRNRNPKIIGELRRESEAVENIPPREPVRPSVRER